MITLPIYLEDAYQKEMQARILELIQESENRWQIVLDKTVFYPRGGGQPTDQGFLYTDTWKAKVYQVMQKGDKILHYVETDFPPEVGNLVNGVIDWERRYLHMRLHSACHIADFALYMMGYSPDPLTPIKGDSGKKPTIWYQGTVEEDFQKELEEKCAELIAQDLPFSFRFVTYEELEREAIYLQPGLPKNKPLRLLTLKGVGSVADGGTQVRTTGEVSSISILPIEKKDNQTLIHLRLE